MHKLHDWSKKLLWQRLWLGLCTKQVVSARVCANQFLPYSSSGIALFGMKTVQADSCLNSEQNGTVFIYRQANNIASGGPFGSLCYSEIVSLCFPSKVNFMIIFWPSDLANNCWIQGSGKKKKKQAVKAGLHHQLRKRSHFRISYRKTPPPLGRIDQWGSGGLQASAWPEAAVFWW